MIYLCTRWLTEVGNYLQNLITLEVGSIFLSEFLHCTPVGSKPGIYMPNMAVPDLNKIGGVATLCMCRAIFVYTSKTGQYDVLSVGTFKDWPVESIMKSQVAAYKKSVVAIFHKLVCVFLLNCYHICKLQE